MLSVQQRSAEFCKDINLYNYLQNCEQPIVCLSFDMQIILASKVACRFLKWPEDKVIGENFFELCGKHGYLAAFPDDLKTLVAQNGYAFAEIALGSKKRTTVIRWKVIQLFQNNEPIGYILTGTVLSSQLFANRQVMGSKFDYEDLLSFLPGYVYWKDINGLYLGCNDLLAKTIGLRSRSQIVGKTDYDMPWKESAAELQKDDKAVAESGEVKYFEESIKISAKAKPWFQTIKVPLRNSTGKVVGILGVSLDITKLKSRESALLKAQQHTENLTKQELAKLTAVSEKVLGAWSKQYDTPGDFVDEVRAYLEEIIASIPGFLCWKDRDREYLGCNDYLCRTIGLKDRRDIVGKTDAEIAKALGWHSDVLKEIRAADKRIIETGKPESNVVLEITKEDGDQMVMLTSRRPLKNAEGLVIGLVSIYIDITEQKKIERALIEAKERAEIANQAKSNFLATMNHELRTPLNTILGVAQILRDRDLPSEVKDYNKLIYQSGNHLLNLINDVLDFAKLNEGHLHFISTPVDLQLLFDDIAKIMGPNAEKKGLKFNMKYPSNVPSKVCCDIHRVRQVVFNLLDNAIKFTNRGFVKMRVLCVERSGNLARLRFIVEDSGIGVAEDKAKTIFDRFTRLESGYERRYQGTGLGLALAKQLVEYMGGRIGVESAFGKGSTFWCEIPFVLHTAVRLDEPKQKADSVTTVLERIKAMKPWVLLVEDNPINRKVTKVMLEELGCQLDVAETGREAIEKSSNLYDLIFMDIGLPDISGIEVTKEIRHREVGKLRTSIVAMTAHALDEDRQKCLEAGMDDVLTKPVLHESLKPVLARWVAQRLL